MQLISELFKDNLQGGQQMQISS